MGQFLSHPLVVGSGLLIIGALLAAGGRRWRSERGFRRDLSEFVHDFRDHVEPHFRPATAQEIREGRRTYGDTIPERLAVVEKDTATQTHKLSEHLDAEQAETGKINDRLGRIERHMRVPEES